MSRQLQVTDHAVLRYLERVGGFDIAKLRAEMADRIAAARVPGTPYVQLDGVCFVVRDDLDRSVVTTTLTGAGARKPRKKRKGHRK